MSVYYREIADKSMIPECVRLQQEIFSTSDIDTFPSSFYFMLVRKELPLGMLLGCFKNEKLIGMATGITGPQNNSMYIPFAGIIKEYQNTSIGFRLISELKNKAFSKGINCIYGIFDPLEARLGKLYSSMNAIFTEYITEPYTLIEGNDTVDKLVFQCYNKQEDKISCFNKVSFRQIIDKYPIVCETGVLCKEFLIEIPLNYSLLKNENPLSALEWRKKSRELFTHYINNNKYVVKKCLNGMYEGTKRIFYLLEK